VQYWEDPFFENSSNPTENCEFQIVCSTFSRANINQIMVKQKVPERQGKVFGEDKDEEICNNQMRC
jgi:hypothetical protein